MKALGSIRIALGLAIAVSLLLATGPAAVHADSPTIRSYTVDAPSRMTIGDRFEVTIVVEADRGTRIEIAPGGIPEELALAESPRTSTREVPGGRVELRMEIVLAAFVVGDYPMPPLTLRYREAGGGNGELRTPASRLLVESVLPASGAVQPRDLKPQAAIGAPPAPPYVLVAVAGAAFALALALSYVAWRRLQRPARTAVEVEPEPEVLSPEDAARRSLDGAGARFADDRDYVAYYTSLSSTVRGYLTTRFEFPAFALTTAEMRERMTRRGLDRWQARLVAGLLDQCDAVVFAGYRPALERADADLTAAYEIVEMSRPQEQPEQVAV